MVWIKRVNNADSGDATHVGGDHWDTNDKYHDDVDVSASLTNPTKINTPTTFRDQIIKIRNAGNTFSYNVKSGTLTANADLVLPDASGNITLIASGAANNWGALMQTFRDDNIKIMNPANTFGYIFSTSAIVADRTITLPLLTTNDTLVTNDFTATLQNKTLNIDVNTIKHSTTNAQGDLYKYDSTSGKIIRVPRGSTGQVLTADASDISWATPAGGGGGGSGSVYDDLKTSSGFKYGTWTGILDTGDAPDRSGDGLFTNLDIIGGSASQYIDTTNGFQGISYPMTSSSADVGMRGLSVITMRKLNPDFTCCFQLDEGGDNTGSRVWIGFSRDIADAADTDSYLNSNSGICLSKVSGDSVFKITSNDGDATQDSTASVLATDSGTHTVRIFATEASSKWSYSIDGAASVDVSAEIPGATDTLGIILAGSQSDSASRNFRLFWAKLKMKERV